ncbi:MAG: RNA polymerase sigma factor [Bacteroidia bacterium]|nr:RNA polymerase sigma factor [Bacteroidia bacterium]
MFVFGKISDEYIVERIKSNDEKILLHLYKEYHSLIKSFIMKNGGDNENIDDIVQDTIISLWKNIQKPTFLLHAKLSTYVIAIAKNKWFRELKKRSKFRRVDATHSRTIKASNTSSNPDHAIILKILQEMDETCRRLLAYFYFDGLNNKSIAEKLNFANANTVKSKKYQCFKKLQATVLEQYQKDDFI